MTQSKRGRPRGPSKKAVLVRIDSQLCADLEFLSLELDGTPSVPKLIAYAAREYVKEKLADPVIREAYRASRASPPLRIVGGE